MTQRHLKIWHLLESYAPDYGGGAAIVTRDVCRLLAERGHEVARTVRRECGGSGLRHPHRLRRSHSDRPRQPALLEGRRSRRLAVGTAPLAPA